MISQRDALYRAILANPDDDTPRLVFADYLEETGQAKYARVVRTQIELAKVPEWDPFWVRSRFHDPDVYWGVGALPPPRLPEGVEWAPESFHRGFHSAVRVCSPNALSAHANQLFRTVPIDRLEVIADSDQQLLELCALTENPEFDRIRNLRLVTLHPCERTAAVVDRLQTCPHLTGLDLQLTTLGPQAAASLFQPPLITRLTSLHTEIVLGHFEEWLRAVRGVPAPCRLRSLGLFLPYAVTRAASFPGLFETLLFHALVELTLFGGTLGPGAFRELTASPVPARLESFSVLAAPDLAAEDIQLLSGCPGFQGLRQLRLAYSGLGPEAAVAITGSPQFRNLRVLELSGNAIGDDGARALARSPHLGGLVYVGLYRCGIGDAGARALLDAPFADGVLHLALTEDGISPSMKKKLKKRFGGTRVWLTPSPPG